MIHDLVILSGNQIARMLRVKKRLISGTHEKKKTILVSQKKREI
jgi:hypothetical protein